jgi:hypothetical protein
MVYEAKTSLVDPSKEPKEKEVIEKQRSDIL